MEQQKKKKLNRAVVVHPERCALRRRSVVYYWRERELRENVIAGRWTTVRASATTVARRQRRRRRRRAAAAVVLLIVKRTPLPPTPATSIPERRRVERDFHTALSVHHPRVVSVVVVATAASIFTDLCTDNYYRGKNANPRTLRCILFSVFFIFFIGNFPTPRRVTTGAADDRRPRSVRLAAGESFVKTSFGCVRSPFTVFTIVVVITTRCRRVRGRSSR